jgi:thioredoxin reductase (NADPH)
MNSTTADKKIAATALFPRYEQTFPELTSQEIARMRRYGEIAKYKDGEKLYETGKAGYGMFVILRRPWPCHAGY